MTVLEFLIAVAVWCGDASNKVRSTHGVESCRTSLVEKCQSKFSNAQAMVDCFKSVKYE